jgi:hypothetical protein
MTTMTNRAATKKEMNFSKLNEIQLGLLRMFSRPMTVEQTLNLKRIIVNYLSDELDKEVERVVQEKNITNIDFEALKHQHQRTTKK